MNSPVPAALAAPSPLPSPPSSPEPWRAEPGATLRLALPPVGTQPAQIAIMTTNALFVGWPGIWYGLIPGLFVVSVLATARWVRRESLGLV